MNLILYVILLIILIPVVIVLFIAGKGYFAARNILKRKPVLSVAEEIRKKETFCPIDAVSKKCKQVIVGTEDANFYRHHGVDWNAWKRCMIYNIKTGFWQSETINGVTLKHRIRGASTITNQVAKLLFLSMERTVTRKAAEFFITRELEKNLTKDQILELYLNIVDFGDECTGIAPASMHYFHIQPDQLGIGQSVSLQAIMKFPAWFHPVRSPESFKSSRNFGIGSLVINHVISADTAAILKEAPWDQPDDDRVNLLVKTNR